MKVSKTAIAGVLLVEPKVFSDARGLFMELYHHDRYVSSGIPRRFAQDNLSRSARGVLRGLHLQSPRPQGKLVTVLRGSVLDVAVDVRVGSPTFGRHIAVELNENSRLQLWLPPGCAHGFLVRSETADFFYKCDDVYSPADELVLRWNDPELGIDWGCESPTISPRDSEGSLLAELTDRLPLYEPA